jgi:tetratricopeptide (TPR) repeat protein
VARSSAPPTPPAASLRGEILALLAQSPDSTPSQLAKTLERSTTVVSRVLTTLLDAGLVAFEKDSNDGRIRLYRLTTPEASNEQMEASASEELRQYLGLVIAAAVRARRRKNDLRYAADRLRRVLKKATAAGIDDLALIARRELLTTLRQAGDFDDEVQTHLDALREIAVGNERIAPHLVAPATACLDYELGRKASLPARVRFEHLTTAATVFERCEQLKEAHDWAPREGWALLASAELWRQQTEFGLALAHAKRAEAVFGLYDDTYGSAEATRMQGFCQRLRGNFDEAIDVLERAVDLANDGSARRCLADVLLQLGDALRCLGRLEPAAETLLEAASIAGRLNRTRTLGFTHTALAAVEYSRGNLDGAWKLTREAELELITSQPGRALNSRRQAVIARDLAANGDPSLGPQSAEHFDRSLMEYRELGSPAGIAACCVGLGQADNSHGATDAAIKGLVGVASSTAGRLLLPIDPWIPSLVNRWADETDDRDVRRVADWTYRSDKTGESGVDEMAGEPRLQSRLLTA